MVCGTPVLVSEELVDTAEDIELDRGVRIAQCSSKIADVVVHLSLDATKRKEMSQKGREWVLKNLDGKDVAVRVEKMYAEAILSSE